MTSKTPRIAIVLGCRTDVPGSTSSDSSNAALLRAGLALAFLPNLDCVAGVTEIPWQDGECLVTRRTDQGVDRARCAAPRVLALAETHGKTTTPDALSQGTDSIVSAAELFSDASELLLSLRSAKLWTTP